MWRWGECRPRRPLQPGELEAIGVERRRREAEQAKNRVPKSPRTEEEIFEDLLGPTGRFGLESIDLASQAQANRFCAWLARRHSGQGGNQ